MIEPNLALFDQAPVMMWLTDPSGYCTFLNRRWYDYTGQSREEGLGYGWLKAVHPEDRSRAEQAFLAANEKQETFRFEYRLLSKKGEYRWAIDAAAPQYGPDGKFLGLIGSVIDIHDRKEAEEKEQGSNERYRQLFEAIDEGFCVLEMLFDEGGRPFDYRFLEINPSFEKQTGLTDASGKTVRAMVPDLDQSWFEIYGKVATTGESIRFQNYAPAMNRWFDVFAFRVDHPEQRRVALLFTDITERKARESNVAFLAGIGAYLAKARRPREVMAEVGDEVCRHLQVDRAVFMQIDGEAETADVLLDQCDHEGSGLGGVHRLDELVPRDTIERLQAGKAIAFPGGGEERAQILAPCIDEGQWRFLLVVSRRGSREWHDSEVDLMRELAARVWLRLERARAEENLRLLSRSLEQRVVHRTAELQEQTIRLRKMAAEVASAEQRERKRLAALLHDDLQQLLVAASMRLTNAARHMSDLRNRQAIEQATKWIAEATSAARDLTRQLRPPALYEGSLVAALHGLAGEMAERHRLRVTIDGGEETTSINDDMRALLFESIRELLFNAAKYSGVNRAKVRVWEEGKCLRVVVEDQGEGFDLELAAKSQTDGGFGLFSIRERLAALGGEMTIVSAVGEGTRIEMEVPLLAHMTEEAEEIADEDVSERKAQELLAKKESRNRIRILLVDDHAMVRQGLATLLNEDEGLAVVAEASDGRAAIEAYAHHRPDVILIDVNMPRMNGIEATREICRRWPDAVIIGLSVQDDEATAKAMVDAGATTFLSKAGDSDRMIATILGLAKPDSSDSQG